MVCCSTDIKNGLVKGGMGFVQYIQYDMHKQFVDEIIIKYDKL